MSDSSNAQPVLAADVPAELAPPCPQCAEPMPYYGGSGGYICHDFKLLVRAGGWFEADGAHVRDRRLTGDTVRHLRRHRP